MNRKILVVDDEAKVVDMVKTYLEREGFVILTAGGGKDALAVVTKSNPDLIVLDWMMPGLSGIEALKELRKVSQVPVIMLTAKAEEIDKLVGLEMGADDYIIKPFSLRELTARIKALLRRTASQPVTAVPDVTAVGNLILDANEHQVLIDGQPIESLTPTEFKLLGLLVRNPGRVFTRLQLLEHALGEAYEGYERSLDTHVSNLRRKIDTGKADTPFIKTVHGIGYKLELGRQKSENRD